MTAWITMDAAEIKSYAKELGADLVGIASAKTLNAFPPDPLHPQTPERISTHVKSVIVIVQRIPAGVFRCKTTVPVQYIDMLVLRRMDKIAYRMAEALEREGHPSFVTAAQETDWSYKRASYGRLSDQPMTEQVCIGESCSRCLYACPSDAVRHFGIDKRNCATEAQEFGFSTILKFWERFLATPAGKQRGMLADREVFGFWQGLLRVVGSFGDCPRCLAVCPVGNDYHAYLTDTQKAIPEKTPEKVDKAKGFKLARRDGDEVSGLNAWNIRWVGPEGYKGIVARQLQEFKKRQRERAEQTETE